MLFDNTTHGRSSQRIALGRPAALAVRHHPSDPRLPGGSVGWFKAFLVDLDSEVTERRWELIVVEAEVRRGAVDPLIRSDMVFDEDCASGPQPLT